MTVEAAYSKRRRRDVLPPRTDTALALSAWIKGKVPKARAFAMPAQSWVLRLLKADLAAAKIQPIDDPIPAIDFHSLRHTFLTNLARAGGISSGGLGESDVRTDGGPVVAGELGFELAGGCRTRSRRSSTWARRGGRCRTSA